MRYGKLNLIITARAAGARVMWFEHELTFTLNLILNKCPEKQIFDCSTSLAEQLFELGRCRWRLRTQTQLP